ASGQWEVQDVTLSPDKKMFWLATNEGDWGQVHFWAVPVTGGARTQLTSAEGRQDVVVSPDGKTLAVLASTANHPAELFFQQNHAGAAPRRVTESTSPEWRSYGWIKPEIVAVPASDGARLPARLYRPVGPPNHAAVIFVRSEEHTSELQSRSDLVCRLLLEKKKQIAMRRNSKHNTLK